MALNFLLKRSNTASKRPVAASMTVGELNVNYDADTGGLFYKDSAGNVMKVGPVQVGTTAPNVVPAGSSGNSKGELWYDSAESVLKVYDGTSFVSAVAGASGSFTSQDGKTITVTNGIITSIV